MITYNLNDYTNILLNNPNVSLSDDVLSVYKTLVSNLNITTVTSTSSVRTDTETRDRRGGYRRNKNTKRSDLLTSYKVVEFKQRSLVDEDGPEKLMITIKASLNKLTNKNYDSHRDIITTSLEELNDKYDDTYMETFTNHLFDIASKNKFYSEMYATLYKELEQIYPILQERKSKFIEECVENLDTIQYIDENADYDGFCKNNKMNDIRRAMNIFMINLFKKDICDISNIMKIMSIIQTKVLTNRDVENTSYITEELTENLFIFVSESSKELRKHRDWETTRQFIIDHSKIKAKDHVGLTSRIIFKYMDMVDLLKKY